MAGEAVQEKEGQLVGEVVEMWLHASTPKVAKNKNKKSQCTIIMAINGQSRWTKCFLKDAREKLSSFNGPKDINQGPKQNQERKI